MALLRPRKRITTHHNHDHDHDHDHDHQQPHSRDCRSRGAAAMQAGQGGAGGSSQVGGPSSQPAPAQATAQTRKPLPHTFNGDVLVEKEFHAWARAQCHDKAKAYMECNGKEGFMVIFRCRDKLHEFDACLRSWNTPEHFEKWKAENYYDPRKGERP